MSLVGFKARNHPQQRTNPRVDDRATDPDFFARLDHRFHFTIDVAASARNTKCARYYTVEDDGLAQSWSGERVWCNPPYSNIGPWVEKAWKEPNADLIVMLLPANRTEQRWWQEGIEPYRDGGRSCPVCFKADCSEASHLFAPRPLVRVEFLPGRLRFIAPDKDVVGPNERPPFGCCLTIWTPR